MEVRNAESGEEIILNKRELKALDESVRNVFDMFTQEELDMWVKGEINLHPMIDEKTKQNQEAEILERV